VIDQLTTVRARGESYSRVIIRVAGNGFLPSYAIALSDV
jgi:hypothetical protein